MEFHVNNFTIFSLIITPSTDVTKSLHCKGFFFLSNATWRYAWRYVLRLYWFLWRQWEMISDSLFNKFLSRSSNISSFSVRYRLELFEIGLNNIEILWNTQSKNDKHCNCQQKANWPMNGTCLQESLVYYAIATIRIINRNYTKEVAKQVLRSAIVITKSHLTHPCTNTKPRYQRSIWT